LRRTSSNEKNYEGLSQNAPENGHYGEEVIIQMCEQFSFAELEGKSVEELQALLADERLLMSDSDASNDLIFRIAAVLQAKEGKSEEQLNAECDAFWSGLAARYGDAVPIMRGYATRSRRKGADRERLGALRLFHRLGVGKSARHLAFTAILAAVILAGNALAVFAFNINFLRIVVDYTDDLFSKTFVTNVVTA
jgi:hypothetical protein